MTQNLDALDMANAIRSAHAQTLRAIRAASKSDAGELVAELLCDPDEIDGSLRLDRLLLAIPRYGEVRCRELLVRCGMAPGRLLRRVRELTERERHALATALAPSADSQSTALRNGTGGAEASEAAA